MLINNSTRILNDAWDRVKQKQSVVINVLILAGLKRDGRAGSCNSLEGVGGGRRQRLFSPAGICLMREEEPFFSACTLFLFCQGVFVQMIFGAVLWLFLALSLWESRLLSAMNPCKCSCCSYFCKPWQSGIFQHLAAL